MDHTSFGAELGLDRGTAVTAISKAVQAFSPLTRAITERLKKEKAVTTPAVGILHSQLAFIDRAWLAFSPQGKGKPLHLTTRYWLDPLRLIDLPQNRTQVGELAISIAEDACEAVKFGEKQGFVTDVPASVFDESIAAFREANYAISWMSSLRPLEGTGLKLRYRLEAFSIQTRITLVLVKGRTALWEREVRVLRAGAFDNVATFTTLEGDRLQVHGMLPEHMEPSIYSPIDNLPAEVRAYL